MNPVQPEKSVTSPELAATVRLLHMRRGWLWTLVGSAVAWVVGLVVLGWDGKASGAAVAVAAIFVLLLTAVFVVALVMSIVQTVWLHRARQLP